MTQTKKDYSKDMVRDLHSAQQNIATVLDEQIGELHSILKTAADQVTGVLRWLEQETT